MVESIVPCSVTDIQRDSQVCHYDELPEATKERFPTLLNAESEPLNRSITDGFCECNYVKYVEYYEIIRD